MRAGSARQNRSKTFRGGLLFMPWSRTTIDTEVSSPSSMTSTVRFPVLNRVIHQVARSARFVESRPRRSPWLHRQQQIASSASGWAVSNVGNQVQQTGFPTLLRCTGIKPEILEGRLTALGTARPGGMSSVERRSTGSKSLRDHRAFRGHANRGQRCSQFVGWIETKRCWICDSRLAE